MKPAAEFVTKRARQGHNFVSLTFSVKKQIATFPFLVERLPVSEVNQSSQQTMHLYRLPSTDTDVEAPLALSYLNETAAF